MFREMQLILPYKLVYFGLMQPSSHVVANKKKAVQIRTIWQNVLEECDQTLAS